MNLIVGKWCQFFFFYSSWNLHDDTHEGQNPSVREMCYSGHLSRILPAAIRYRLVTGSRSRSRSRSRSSRFWSVPTERKEKQNQVSLNVPQSSSFHLPPSYEQAQLSIIKPHPLRRRSLLTVSGVSASPLQSSNVHFYLQSEIHLNVKLRHHRTAPNVPACTSIQHPAAGGMQTSVGHAVVRSGVSLWNVRKAPC